MKAKLGFLKNLLEGASFYQRVLQLYHQQVAMTLPSQDRQITNIAMSSKALFVNLSFLSRCCSYDNKLRLIGNPT